MQPRIHHVRSRRAALAAIAIATLCACGGGSGGGSAPSAVTALPTSVSAVMAPAITVADCPRLLDAAASLAALDLAEPSIAAMHTFLMAVDPMHAHQLFLRRPHDFINQVASDGGLLTVENVRSAASAMQFDVDGALYPCAPASTQKILFMGNLLNTALAGGGDTANLSIIDTVGLPPAITGTQVYQNIVVGAAGNPVLDFAFLLEVMAATVTGARTEVRMLQQGLPAATEGELESSVESMMTFMMFMVGYLHATRLNDPATYGAIDNPQQVAAIQALWTEAEAVLQAAHPFTLFNSSPRLSTALPFMGMAYSAQLLPELDLLDVTHAMPNDWLGSYFIP